MQNLGEFDNILTEMGMGAEDGQVFLSEIIFAFDMEYSDIIEAFEIYSQNGFVTKNISKSGNVYLSDWNETKNSFKLVAIPCTYDNYKLISKNGK